jgi:hypothetical protein
MDVDFGNLAAQLDGGQVLVPGDIGYDDAIKRWSATAIKQAVSLSQTPEEDIII